MFIKTNSASTDEMLLFAAFLLGLHCLQKYPSRGSSIQKVKPVFELINKLLPYIQQVTEPTGSTAGVSEYESYTAVGRYQNSLPIPHVYVEFHFLFIL